MKCNRCDEESEINIEVNDNKLVFIPKNGEMWTFKWEGGETYTYCESCFIKMSKDKNKDE